MNSFCVLRCSEASDGGVVAYYQSEFDVHVSQQASLDDAIECQQQQAEAQQGRQGRVLLKPGNPLSISSVISKGQSATRTPLSWRRVRSHLTAC